MAAHYLPNEDPEDPETQARAAWLDKRQREGMEVAVQNAIAKAIKGK